MVERNLAKVDVEGSSPFTRFEIQSGETKPEASRFGFFVGFFDWFFGWGRLFRRWFREIDKECVFQRDLLQSFESSRISAMARIHIDAKNQWI